MDSRFNLRNRTYIDVTKHNLTETLFVNNFVDYLIVILQIFPLAFVVGTFINLFLKLFKLGAIAYSLLLISVGALLIIKFLQLLTFIYIKNIIAIINDENQEIYAFNYIRIIGRYFLYIDILFLFGFFILFVYIFCIVYCFLDLKTYLSFQFQRNIFLKSIFLALFIEAFSLFYFYFKRKFLKRFRPILY